MCLILGCGCLTWVRLCLLNSKVSSIWFVLNVIIDVCLCFVLCSCVLNSFAAVCFGFSFGRVWCLLMLLGFALGLLVGWLLWFTGVFDCGLLCWFVACCVCCCLQFWLVCVVLFLLVCCWFGWCVWLTWVSCVVRLCFNFMSSFVFYVFWLWCGLVFLGCFLLLLCSLSLRVYCLV